MSADGVDQNTEVARCFWHDVDEPYTPRVDYKACSECWHVWPTEADFLADVANTYRDIYQGEPEALAAALARPADDWFHCPLCAHDF